MAALTAPCRVRIAGRTAQVMSAEKTEGYGSAMTDLAEKALSGKNRQVDKPVWLPVAPFIFLMLWSGGFSFAKLALPHIEPMTLLLVRYDIALAMLFVLFLIIRPPLPRRRVDWVHLAVVGFLIQVVYFGMSYIAFNLGVSAGGVALIVSLQPVLVGLLAPKLAGEPVSAKQWLGFALGLAGAAIVIISRSQVAAESPLGIACAVLALIGMTAATLYEKRFGVSQHPLTANVVQYAVGVFGILPFALTMETMRIDWAPELMIALGYLVIGNSLIAITLLLAMIRYGAASKVSALFFLVPPLAAVLAWVMLGEEMPPLAWTGMGIAAFGVALATGIRFRLPLR